MTETTEPEAPDAIPSLNLAVVRGRLSSEPRRRDLPSGASLLNLEITVDHPERRADSVPVAIFDPPRTVCGLATGDEVVAIGSVRRRFFRAGGTTVSRTELVADTIAKASRRTAVRRALSRALAAVDPLVET